METLAILIGGIFVLIALFLTVMYPYPNRWQKYIIYAFLWIGAIGMVYGFTFSSSPTTAHKGSFTPTHKSEKNDK